MPSLGITGGIATGKSSLTTALLRCLPAAHFDADRCAHEILAHDPDIRRAVEKEFGAKSYAPDGSPDRVFLRRVVFDDPARRAQLEAILHPAIRHRWMALASNAGTGGNWLFVDIPLLFETGAESCFSRVVVVACSLETQQRRLTENRGLTRDLALKMISTQIDLPTKMSKADHLIWNDSSPSSLERQAALFGGWLRQSHA